MIPLKILILPFYLSFAPLLKTEKNMPSGYVLFCPKMMEFHTSELADGWPWTALKAYTYIIGSKEGELA